MEAAKTDAAKKQLAKNMEVADKAVAAAKADIENSETELKIAKSSVERLKLGAFYAQVWRAKESLTAKKEEQKRLQLLVESATADIKQAEGDIKAAKKVKTTTKEEKDKLAKRIKDWEKSISDNKKLASTSKSAADKLTKPLQAEEKKVQAIASEYQKLKAAAAPAPIKSAQR